MRLTIERDTALKLLARVEGVSARKGTIPILNNVMLEAREGLLIATTTDLDVQATDEAAAQVDAAGRVTVDSKRLYDIVRAFPAGGEIGLTYDTERDPRVAIQCGRARYLLHILPADQFPVMTADDLSAGGLMPRDALKRLLDRVRYAASVQDTRHYLNGVHFHAHTAEGARGLRAVAADTHRMAMSEVDLPEGFDEFPPVIVPTKTVDEIRRLLDGAPDEVTLRTNGQRIALTFEGAELISRLIDGTFPDYQRLIPRGSEIAVDLDAELFGAIVRRAALASDEKVRALRLDLETDRLLVSCRGAEVGEAREEIDVAYDGGPFSVGFNAKYLQDVVGRTNGETFTIKLNSPEAPAVVLDSADPRALSVLMPLRV